MDGGDRLGGSPETTQMTEGKSLLASNGEAGNKGKKLGKVKSPRRFRRKALSAERETTSSSAPASPDMGFSEPEERTASSNSSTSNSQKRHLARLFRRASPVRRTRSLSASRRRKRRSKSSDAAKTDSVVGESDAEKSYRTFDPHRKPRGRLRKMTVQEAREEQKQRLLDSVSQLPIYVNRANAPASNDSAFFRSRSGTSSSLPDITKCRQNADENLDDKLRNESSANSKDNSVISKRHGHGHKTAKSSPENSNGGKDSKKKVKGGSRHSPETKPKTGNRNHSEQIKASSVKPRRKFKKDKSKQGNSAKSDSSPKAGPKNINDKNSKQKTDAQSVDTLQKDFKNQPEPTQGGANDDIVARRRQSLAKFLALSKMSSLDSNRSDRDEERGSELPESTKNSAGNARKASAVSRWQNALPKLLTDKYKSTRQFGRSVSSHPTPEAANATSAKASANDRSKRSRSESTKRTRQTKSSDNKASSVSPGIDSTGKYKRTFSPARKQIQDEVLESPTSPAVITNKSDTECNEDIRDNATSDAALSNTPVGSVNCMLDESELSAVPTDTSGKELASDSECPQSDCGELALVNSENLDTKIGDKIQCQAVIETPGKNVPSESNKPTKSTEDVSTAKGSKQYSKWNRLSPDPCLSQSDEELFFDADDSLSDDAGRSKNSGKLSPSPDPAGQHRGSLVTDDIPFIEEVPDVQEPESPEKTTLFIEEKKPGKLSFKALILAKRLSRRSKSVRAKKKSVSPRSSLPDVRIEDYDNETNKDKDKDEDKQFVVIENESGKTDQLEPPFPFSGVSRPVIDERGILKKELQFEPVASDEPLPGEDEGQSMIVPALARRRESKYYKLVEKRKKVVSALKQFLAFLFSQVGLISLVVGYSIMGGFLFKAIEGPNEKTYRNQIRIFRDKTVADLRQLALNVQIDKLDSANFSEHVNNLLKNFQMEIYLATKEQGWDGDDNKEESLKQWSYASSLLYAITVMTTIGYGHVAPITSLGRLVTIGYAVFGIPLTLLCLTNMGDLMAQWFRVLYGRVCCGLCCLCFRRRPKRLPDPEKGECHVTTDEPKDKSKEVTHVPASLCIIVIVGYIMGGAFLFAMWENWDYLTGSYFCFITLSTIGFGDIVPGMEITSWAQQEKLVLCTLYLVIGLSLLAMCFTLVQEDVRAKCKWIGEKIGIIEKPLP